MGSSPKVSHPLALPHPWPGGPKAQAERSRWAKQAKHPTRTCWPTLPPPRNPLRPGGSHPE